MSYQDSKKCDHQRLIKIKHWWYNFKCDKCNKKFKWIPRGEYFFLKSDED